MSLCDFIIQMTSDGLRMYECDAKDTYGEEVNNLAVVRP